MSSMNLSTQKRLGVLPKTEETLTYKGHIYGNTHRGFRGRTPKPIASHKSPGFFGVHGLGAAGGDGKLHYFGDGPGQADLPMNGFYGIGMADLDYQAGNMLIADPTENQPTNPANQPANQLTNQSTKQAVKLATAQQSRRPSHQSAVSPECPARTHTGSRARTRVC